MAYVKRIFVMLFNHDRSPFKKTSVFVMRHRLLLFCTLLLSFIMAYPMVSEHNPEAILITEVLGTVVLLVGVYIVSENRQMLTVSILLVLLTLVVIIFNKVLQSEDLQVMSLVCEIVFFTLILLVVLVQVFRHHIISADKIYGAICGYLLLGTIWALIYTLIEFINPGSFEFSTQITLRQSQYAHPNTFPYFIYYSFVTISTLGYGDITPISSSAQMPAAIEAVVGQLYIAVLIARLVGLEIIHVHLKSNKRK